MQPNLLRAVQQHAEVERAHLGDRTQAGQAMTA